MGDNTAIFLQKDCKTCKSVVIRDMKTIHKAYKFRIYPNESQKILLSKHFGCSRFVFNYFLNLRKEKYLKDNTSLNYYDNASALTSLKKTDEYNWLKEVNSQSLQQSLRNLDVAYNKFFKKLSNFPKFKSKNNKQSFMIPQSFKLIENNKLSIPKFKESIKINIHREVIGKMLSVTISKSRTDKYYASILCEVNNFIPFEKNKNTIGIDTGIKDLAILSDGTKYENIKSLKTNLKKLKYEQRQLSKKKKDSNGRKKQKLKVALVYEKITNKRTDHLHKVTIDIVNKNQVICIEDLNVKGMVNDHKLAQLLMDVSLGRFYQFLEYKSGWHNRDLVEIDRYFPSSKMCHRCNWINQNLKLSDRNWKCPRCNSVLDRDFNASINIRNQGINVLSGSGIESDIKQKQVKAFSLEKSMKLEALSFREG